jgi:hypothetical protein
VRLAEPLHFERATGSVHRDGPGSEWNDRPLSDEGIRAAEELAVTLAAGANRHLFEPLSLCSPDPRGFAGGQGVRQTCVDSIEAPPHRKKAFSGVARSLIGYKKRQETLLANALKIVIAVGFYTTRNPFPPGVICFPRSRRVFSRTLSGDLARVDLLHEPSSRGETCCLTFPCYRAYAKTRG